VTGDFYSDATVTIVTGTVNTINRIGSVLSTTGNLSIGGTIIATGTTTTPTAIVNAVEFPATQVPSANVNTLDDYKEGTWTPVVAFGGASVGITYDATNTTGRYVKIGSTVFVWGRIILTSQGSSTGNATISLPITSSSSLPTAAVTVAFCYQTSPVFNGGIISASSTSLNLIYSGGLFATNAQFTNSTDIVFSAIYAAQT
jgi:hypothetical protein